MAARGSSVADRTSRELVVIRSFDAPRRAVFKAWTDPKRLACWWGPQGFTNPVCELDPRPGGKIFIRMVGPDGALHPTKGTVHEIDEPERFVFTSSAFQDETGNALLEVLNTVAFAERGGKTQVTLTARVVKASPQVARALAGMDEGWNQSLDRLAAWLATV